MFDEPLSNLDAELRVQTWVEIAKLHQILGNTIIYVTHDQTEMMTLADQIVVRRAGRVEQVGAPMDLYNDPDNAFVAGFINSPRMTFVPAAMAGGVMPKVAMTMDIRPEHLDQTEGARLPVTVEVVEKLGGTSFVHGRLDTGEAIVAEQRETLARAGANLDLHFDRARVRFFDAAGLRLR